MPQQERLSEKPILAFNAGKWSEKTYSRFDLDKYSRACKQLENMYAQAEGGAERRAGTLYIADAADHTRKSRLMGFNYDTEQSYILELSHLKMRFFKDLAQLESGGSPYEITTPWTEDDIFEVQEEQINDVIYTAQRNNFPQKLTRFGDTNWTLEDTPFSYHAFLEENITTTTLAPGALTGLGISLTASANVFQAGHVGSFWKISHTRQAQEQTLSLTATGISGTVIGRGEVNLVTTGRWDGNLQLQAQSNKTGAWETIREYTSVDASLNVDILIEEDELSEDTNLRVNYTNGTTPTPGSSPATAHLIAASRLVGGVIKITAVTDGQNATGDVVSDFIDTTATTNWCEGAWSDVRGHPRAVASFDERSIYGGTEYERQTIWGSQTGNYEDLETGTLDTDAFKHTFSGKQQNVIQAITGHNRLIVFTSGGEKILSGTTVEDAITPTNVNASTPSSYGSAYLQAQIVNDVILFAQRNGRKVREYIEDDLSVSGKYKAPDMTILSDDITSGKIVQTAYSQQPDSIYWAVTGDGRLIGLSYERDEDVVAWHEHTTDGEIESVATIYGDDGDEVWISVKRTIDGNTRRYIEVIDPTVWTEMEDMHYVDSGVKYSNPILTSGALVAGEDYRVIDPTGMDLTAVGGSATPEIWSVFTATASVAPTYGTGSLRRVQTTFTGLDHLEGKTVQILGDGAVIPPQTVSGGSVSVPEPEQRSSVAHIGLQYVSKLQPMNLEADLAGAAPASEKRVRNIVPYLIKSLGLKYTTNVIDPNTGELEVFEVPFRDTTDQMDFAPPLRSGYLVEDIDMNFDKEADITLIQDYPLPLFVESLTLKHNATGER